MALTRRQVFAEQISIACALQRKKNGKDLQSPWTGATVAGSVPKAGGDLFLLATASAEQSASCWVFTGELPRRQRISLSRSLSLGLDADDYTIPDRGATNDSVRDDASSLPENTYFQGTRVVMVDKCETRSNERHLRQLAGWP